MTNDEGRKSRSTQNADCAEDSQLSLAEEEVCSPGGQVDTCGNTMGVVVVSLTGYQKCP